MTFRNCLTPPAAEPITVAEARVQIHSDNDTAEEDALLARIIKAARERVEFDTGRLLATQTWEMRMYYWPRHLYILLLTSPVQRIERFEYTDTNGTHSFAASDYFLDHQDARRRPLLRIQDGIWPGSTLTLPHGLYLTFVCGYAEVPASLREAMQALIAYWYDNREVAIASTVYKAEVSVLPLRYQELIGPYKLLP